MLYRHVLTLLAQNLDDPETACSRRDVTGVAAARPHDLDSEAAHPVPRDPCEPLGCEVPRVVTGLGHATEQSELSGVVVGQLRKPALDVGGGTGDRLVERRRDAVALGRRQGEVGGGERVVGQLGEHVERPVAGGAEAVVVDRFDDRRVVRGEQFGADRAEAADHLAVGHVLAVQVVAVAGQRRTGTVGGQERPRRDPRRRLASLVTAEPGWVVAAPRGRVVGGPVEPDRVSGTVGHLGEEVGAQQLHEPNGVRVGGAEPLLAA